MRNFLDLIAREVSKETNSGLAIRLVLVSLIMMVSFILAWGISLWFEFDFGLKQLIVVFLIIFGSTVDVVRHQVNIPVLVVKV